MIIIIIGAFGLGKMGQPPGRKVWSFLGDFLDFWAIFRNFSEWGDSPNLVVPPLRGGWGIEQFCNHKARNCRILNFVFKINNNQE